MDEKDKLILSALRKNARISMNQIANEVYLSRSAVQERIAKLEKQGFIKGYTINEPSKANQAFILVTFSDKKKHCHLIVDALATLPFDTKCYSLAGETDMIIDVRVDNGEDLQIILDEINQCADVETTTKFVYKVWGC